MEFSKYWWECGETGTSVHCFCECKMVHSLWKPVWPFLSKLNTELPYDLNISEVLKFDGKGGQLGKAIA